MSNSIRLLKTAAAAQVGGNVLGQIIKSIGKGGYRVVKGGADIGGGIAKAVGGNELIGQAVGGGAVLGGGYVGGKKLNLERKRWMYQHNFGGYR